VSAPSLPSLLSLQPGADPGNLLASLTLGTEVELSLGGGLRAALSHKQVGAGDGGCRGGRCCCPLLALRPPAAAPARGAGTSQGCHLALTPPSPRWQVREGERGAEVRLTWQLSRQVRVQAALRSLRMSPTVLLQYSSEGGPA
jgi:hypothetical protein